MKKLLAIVVLGLLMTSCVANLKEFHKMSFKEKTKMLYDRDHRINLFSNDEDILYLSTYASRLGKKIILSDRREYSNPLTGEVYHQDIYDVAKRICKTKLNKKAANFIGTRVMTKNEVKDLKLFGVEYDIFKCAKSRSEIAEEKLKKIQNKQGSNNTDKVSFKCIDSISKKITKIKISGKTAMEITYMGNSIKYFLVTKKDGKYTLRQPDVAQTRSWLIGAMSFLLIDTDVFPHQCS
jgi:hypothetical protein